MFKRLFSPRVRDPIPASIPDGQRVYAIGDIHGRLDLLDELLAMIERDDEQRGGADTSLVFLGDLVDRGPQSAQVVERIRQLHESRPGTRTLVGNHEELFLLALEGNLDAMRVFCRVGGRETMLSYGIDEAEYEAMGHREAAIRLAEIVPATHREFLSSLEDSVVIGDYAFVHAGVRPGVAIENQRTEDLRWIREPFLSHRLPLEKIVVHGHTITDDVQDTGIRIGLDTGAFRTGRLSAVGLEQNSRWIIDTAGRKQVPCGVAA